MKKANKAQATKTPARAKRAPKRVTFIEKPACATCRKARNFMKKRGVHLNYRDLTKDRLTAPELEKLIGDQDHEEFCARVARSSSARR